MSVDLERLTPGEWTLGRDERTDIPLVHDDHGRVILFSETDNAADLAFCALARNAFDIQMRLGWGVRQVNDGKRKGQWYAIFDDGVPHWMDAWDEGLVKKQRDPRFFHPDPATAICEAEKFWKSFEASPAGGAGEEGV